MKKLNFTFILILGLWSVLNAQWVSPGNGTIYTMSELVNITDGVVTFEANNYHIHADLTISQNDVLKIDNGYTKIFVENALITIKGSMICENTNRVSVMGDPHFSMRFENATDCEIKKMYFSDGAGIKIIESDVSFIDTKFLYFTREYTNAVIDFMNCNPTIQDCIFMMNESAAISSPANGQGSPQILNCMFDARTIAEIHLLDLTVRGIFKRHGERWIAHDGNTVCIFTHHGALNGKQSIFNKDFLKTVVNFQDIVCRNGKVGMDVVVIGFKSNDTVSDIDEFAHGVGRAVAGACPLSVQHRTKADECK